MVAGELVQICPLYNAEAVHSHLVKVGLRLWEDENASVREAAAAVPGALYVRMRGFPPWENEIMQHLSLAGRSPRWLSRQMFARTCGHLVVQLDDREVFQLRLLPLLLKLQEDRVGNVRMAMTEALAVCLEYEELLELPELGEAVARMSRDGDPDVRSAADKAMAVMHDTG